MKDIQALHRILKDENLTTKIQIYFATTVKGSNYSQDYGNLTKTNLNPVTIRGIVHQISPSGIKWQQYGQAEFGAISIVTFSKYKTWFQKANKIVVEQHSYVVAKDASGNSSLIQDRPNNFINVVLQLKRSKEE